MFVDKVQITISAGKGGDGKVSFRHEKFIDRGGPDGGDAGNGGDVVLQASRNQNTLANFRYQKTLKAEDGQPGDKQRKHGRSAPPLNIAVPVGTVVTDAKGVVLADLAEDGQEVIIAMGGKGGFGNAHFVSSVRQAPKVAEKGEPGEHFTATFELKMIADVGLVGLPNAGKSTLLSVISNARPEIADYPFTTLRPNLGVVDIDKSTSLLIADIPGLIEGASQGKGLGVEFLRHVERTAVLIHLIDIYDDDVVGAYKTIQKELKEYSTDLSKRPQIVVVSKIEGLDDDIIEDKLEQLRAVVPKKTPLMAISSTSKQGVKELLYAVTKTVKAARRKAAEAKPEEQLPVYSLVGDEGIWTVAKEDDIYIVKGAKIERFASRTHFDTEEGVQRLRDIMSKMGIMHELQRKGVEPGQAVQIGSDPDNTLIY